MNFKYFSFLPNFQLILGIVFYQRRENVVLNGLSLQICPGEILVLTGASGGGKSTLINLIYRLYEPIEGNILLDGVDIASRPLRWIRDKVAIVEQDPALFSGSIRDNISYALPTCNFGDVTEAAKKANAHDFIMSFPQGEEANCLVHLEKISIMILLAIIISSIVLLFFLNMCKAPYFSAERPKSN